MKIIIEFEMSQDCDMINTCSSSSQERASKSKHVMFIPQEIIEKYMGPQNFLAYFSRKDDAHTLKGLNDILKDAYYSLFCDSTDVPEVFLNGELNPEMRMLRDILETDFSAHQLTSIFEFESFIDNLLLKV